MSALDQMDLATRFQAGETVDVEAEGETYAVAPEDVEVRITPPPATAWPKRAATWSPSPPNSSQSLIEEGYARELVRRIQQLRKDANLEISDRIVTYIADSDLMHDVLAHFGDYVREETLSVDLVQVHQTRATRAGAPAAGYVRAGWEQVTVAVGKK